MAEKALFEKVALITGAASGIGQAAAFTFGRQGARVLLADINREDGEVTAEQVRRAGADAIFVQADVTKAAEVEELVSQAVSRWGRLDCAFNNAGIQGARGPTAETTEENWDHVLAVNLKGVWLCMKYELAQMLKQGAGSIVNMSSATGLVAFPNLSAYVASKHGVVGLTKAAALEYAKSGIRINALCPGAVRTAKTDSAIREGIVNEPRVLATQPIGRWGRPEEIAEAAAWLCSDASSFVLGHAMAIDGGWVAV
jgi:NAD(P)-dependent dehydrogenase (short-subunit alcohol dehydrogenase family)